MALVALLVVSLVLAQAEAAAPGMPAATPAQIVAQINALSAKIDYVAPDGVRVLSHRYTTVLDAQQRQLIVTRATQSFVATNLGASRTTVETTIPLDQVAVASLPDRAHKTALWTLDVHEVGFVCNERKKCVQASAQGARGAYQGYGYECDASKCPALKQALGQLLAVSQAKPASAVRR